MPGITSSSVSPRKGGDESGVPVTATFWFVPGVRGRKVARFDMYAGREQALEAVGLSE
jgi:hypothetical protein